MADAKTFTVVAPLCVIKLDHGGYAHIYKGGEVPENADSAQLEQLVAQKMVAAGKDADKAALEESKASVADDSEPAKSK